jgi:hypothetical protein
VTASATTAPDGTNTACAWNIATSGTSSLVRIAAVNTNSPISSSVYGGPYTFSVYVKNRNCTATNFELSLYNGPYTIGYEPVYSITSSFTPAVSNFPGNTTFSNLILRSEDVGNGWYRISHTATVTSSLNTFNVFFDIEAGGGTKVAGEGIYIWGPQFETGPAPTPYQPTTNTTPPWPSIGSTITGSMVNRPTWVSSNGGSVVFDGVNDYTTIDNAISNNSDFSISFWMNYLGGDTQVGILSTWDTSWNGIGLATSIVSSPEWTLRSWTNNGASGGMNWGVLNNLKNTWSNIVLTYNFAAKRQSGYINGIFLNSEVFGTTLTHSTLQIARGGQTASSQLSGYPYSNIRISNMVIYNKTLSQQEITQNYNALKSRFGLS